ncbi:ABC transporter substrate-binding protein [Roseburia hominis]
MKKRKLVCLALTAVMVISMIAGCGVGNKETEEKTEQKKDVVVYGTPTAPGGTFNPVLAYMGSDNLIDNLVYASLLAITPDGSLEGYLAEEYTVSEDQKTIEFKLKDDIVWQDGEEFTADDIAFTLESVAKTDDDFGKVSRIVGAQEFRDGESDTISGITVSDNVVKLELKETYAPLLNNIGTLGIIPKHIWGEIPFEQWGENTELLNNPVGCGPYKITKYNSGESVELEAFDKFFNGKSEISKFILKVVNQDAIVAELTSGNIDFVDVKELKKTEVDELEEEGFKKYSIADNMYQYISFNMRMPIFQDKNLRQAMIYAIDRESILKNIVEGRGSLINAPFIPAGWAAPAENELNDYAYNPDKAIELLEASGWKDSDGDGIRENEEGEKLEFTLRCSNDSKTRENAVLYVKECFEKVGIKVEVSIEEDSVVAEDCIYNHNFEMYALNCYFGQDPDPYPWWSSESASDEPGVGSFNFGSYKSDVVDENINKGLNTMNQDERKEAYLNVAKQINEDAPMIYLYVQDREIMCNPNLEEFNPGTFNIFYNVRNWKFSK